MALSPLTDPVLSGSAVVGSTLTLVNGTVTGGTEPYTYVPKIQRSNDGVSGNWETVADGVLTYEIPLADNGYFFRGLTDASDSSDPVETYTMVSNELGPTLYLNATLGATTANSYCTLEVADSYASRQHWAAKWAELTDNQQVIALLQACKWLETLKYVGKRCCPSTDDANAPQRLSWPRHDARCDGIILYCTFIPPALIEAQVELAYRLALDPDAIIPGGGGGAPPVGPVQKQKLGDLEISYFEARPENIKISQQAPLVLQVYPWLEDMLGCWAKPMGSSRVLLRVRS